MWPTTLGRVRVRALARTPVRCALERRAIERQTGVMQQNLESAGVGRSAAAREIVAVEDHTNPAGDLDGSQIRLSSRSIAERGREPSGQMRDQRPAARVASAPRLAAGIEPIGST